MEITSDINTVISVALSDIILPAVKEIKTKQMWK